MKKLFSACCLCIAAFTSTLTSQAFAVPVISYTAAPGPTITAGQTFNVDVNVTDIADLYAYDFSLRYAPSAVKFVSIAEGSFLPSAGTTFFIPGIVDESAGLISFTGGSLIGDVPGASGSGRLFTFTFNALNVSNNTLAIFSTDTSQFINATFAEIAVGLNERLSVRILNSEGGTVPEPSLLMLLLLGVVAMGVVRRAKKA